jgi:hypothetical protein
MIHFNTTRMWEKERFEIRNWRSFGLGMGARLANPQVDGAGVIAPGEAKSLIELCGPVAGEQGCEFRWRTVMQHGKRGGDTEPGIHHQKSIKQICFVMEEEI